MYLFPKSHLRIKPLEIIKITNKINSLKDIQHCKLVHQLDHPTVVTALTIEIDRYFDFNAKRVDEYGLWIEEP